MNNYFPQWLAELIYTARRRINLKHHQVAKKMGGVDVKHLSRQINPHDEGAKLGVLDFVYYLAVTDLEPLDYIEQVFGRVAVTRGDWLSHIEKITKESAEAVAALVSVARACGGNMSKRDRESAKKEIYDAMRALAAALNRMNNDDDEGCD